jgi:hypothetical protein
MAVKHGTTPTTLIPSSNHYTAIITWLGKTQKSVLDSTKGKTILIPFSVFESAAHNATRWLTSIYNTGKCWGVSTASRTKNVHVSRNPTSGWLIFTMHLPFGPEKGNSQLTKTLIVQHVGRQPQYDHATFFCSWNLQKLCSPIIWCINNWTQCSRAKDSKTEFHRCFPHWLQWYKCVHAKGNKLKGNLLPTIVRKFPVVERLGHCVEHPPPSTAKVKERLGLLPIPPLVLYGLSQGKIHILLYIQCLSSEESVLIPFDQALYNRSTSYEFQAVIYKQISPLKIM